MSTLPPSLTELAARRIVCGSCEMVSDGENVVEPFDAGGGFRTDARAAYADAAVVARLLAGEAPTTAPGGWDAYVRARPSRSVVLMRAGNYPQLCDFKTRPLASDHAPFTAVEREMVSAVASKLTGDVRNTPDFATNETACALVDEGRFSEATALWQSFPVSGIREFNLGIIALLTNDWERAVAAFQRAAEILTPASGWVELALAYRACCEVSN